MEHESTKITEEASGEIRDTEPIVSATDLSFTYPGVEEDALDEVSFTAQRGEILGVTGAVGAGKTTLCMSLAGFAPRNTGGWCFGDLSVTGFDPRTTAGETAAHHIGMVFEDFSAQITQVHILDEVMAPLVNRGVPPEEAESRAQNLLARVGLEHLDAMKRTWDLSGGQQQRVAIAATLATDPEVMMFDNATGMLDPDGKEAVRDIITDLAGETTLIVVDDPDFLVGLADQLLVLDDGSVAAHGPADELLRDQELLTSVGVEPPMCLRTARALGLKASPLTPPEFDRAARPFDVQSPPDSQIMGDGLGDTLVSISDVGYEYADGTRALDTVNLDVHEGEVHAIIGGNGAGKTTLSKLIAGLHKPTEGSIHIDGTDTRDATAADLAWTVGTAFQNPDEQISEATVEEEIAFPLERRRYERTGLFSKTERYDDAYITEQVRNACETVGLGTERLDRDPALLPRGLRRHVTIAEALVLGPSIVLLDEPSVGVDAAVRRELVQTIDRLRRQGRAVILIDHDMDLICDVADTVTVLNHGHVVLQGPTDRVFSTEKWDRLAVMDIRPPQAAQLADHIGIDALTSDELISRLSPAQEVV